jgi:hypothetical protein
MAITANISLAAQGLMAVGPSTGAGQLLAVDRISGIVFVGGWDAPALNFRIFEVAPSTGFVQQLGNIAMVAPPGATVPSYRTLATYVPDSNTLLVQVPPLVGRGVMPADTFLAYNLSQPWPVAATAVAPDPVAGRQLVSFEYDLVSKMAYGIGFQMAAGPAGAPLLSLVSYDPVANAWATVANLTAFTGVVGQLAAVDSTNGVVYWVGKTGALGAPYRLVVSRLTDGMTMSTSFLCAPGPESPSGPCPMALAFHIHVLAGKTVHS